MYWNIFPDVIEFQSEMQRVLTKDGIAIHLMPTATWRLWTNLTHYWGSVRFCARYCERLLKHVVVGTAPRYEASFELQTTEPLKTESTNTDNTENMSHMRVTPRQYIKALWNLSIPKRHGEFGNCISELYYFSRMRWKQLFRRTNWNVHEYATNKMFYSGEGVLDSHLPIHLRQKLSRVLGSSCHIFALKKKGNSDSALICQLPSAREEATPDVVQT